MTRRSGDWNGLALAGGRYVVKARLGTGGMGAVYRAWDRNIDADVVIKVPHSAMLDDPDFAARFTHEIRSLVKLSHPRIVKITDVGDWDGTPFAVLQFLPGGSLEDRQQIGPDGQSAPCEPREVPKWLIGIAQALDYVHSQGYIHRDVKPGNILFDAQGHSFLSDFGVAKVLSESPDSRAARALTGAGKVLGTPEYMAPELIMGERIDGRVDQYALAVTVYELLCGRRPFEGEGEIKTRVLVLHTTTPPPPLSAWQPALAGKLSDAVMKGLAKSPAGRYPNCTALAAAVTAAVKELPARTDERVRVQCPACGKGLLVLAAELARLKQAGQRVPCPACKQPVPLGSATTVTPCSGTLIVNAPGGSGEVRAVPAATPRSGTMIVPGAGTPPPTAAAGRSGTMVVPSQGTPAAAAGRSGTLVVPNQAPATTPRGGTVVVPSGDNVPVARPPGQGRSGTMIVDPAAGAAPPRKGTMVVSRADEDSGAYLVIEPVEPTPLIPVPISPAQREPMLVAVPIDTPATARGPAGRAGLSPQVWVAGGVGAGVALIGAIAFLALAPRGESKPPETAAPRVVPEFPTRKDPSPPALRLENPPKPAPPVSLAANIPAPEVPKDATPAAAPEPATVPAPAPAIESAVTPMPETTVPEPAANETEPRPVEAPRDEWTPQLATLRPTPAKKTLDGVLNSPVRFQNQVVVPDGMYCLDGRSRPISSGGMEIEANQVELGLTRNGSPNVRALNSMIVGIEPRLADALRDARQSNNLDVNLSPAILTVWVTRRGECRLVGASFLVNCQPRFNPNGRPDVEYYTLNVSPEGTRQTKAQDEDWEKPSRMLHIKNVFERKLKAIKMARINATQAQVDAQMGKMFSSIMRDAAVQSTRDAQTLQRLRTFGR